MAIASLSFGFACPSLGSQGDKLILCMRRCKPNQYSHRSTFFGSLASKTR